jgi:hypothetical protein
MPKAWKGANFIECRLWVRIAPKPDARSPDVAILELADRQHRVISTPQLLALGLSRADIKARVRRGWLMPVHRGVYAVGTRQLTDRGRWMAAVLACGDGSALSGVAAGALWGFLQVAHEICVSVSTETGRVSRPGIRVVRAPDLDSTCREGIPVTTVPWTLVDLAARLPQQRLLTAVDEAERLRLWTWADLDAVVDRRRGARGVARLAALRAIRDPLSVHTRSELEQRFLALCRRFSLPVPEVNAELLDVGTSGTSSGRRRRCSSRPTGARSTGPRPPSRAIATGTARSQPTAT